MITSERMAAMFAAIDDGGRRYVMAVLQLEHDRVQAARRPVLRLIDGEPAPVALQTTTRAPVRVKKRSER